MALATLTLLYHSPECFTFPNWDSVLSKHQFSLILPYPHPQPLASTSVLSDPMNLTILGTSCKWNQASQSICLCLIYVGGEGNGPPLQCSCLENPMDRGAWWAAVHGVSKSRTGLSNFTFTFRCHALEKEMATHSSVLAWRIPGTGEPGGLLSMGSHRVRHDSSDLAAAIYVGMHFWD